MTRVLTIRMWQHSPGQHWGARLIVAGEPFMVATGTGSNPFMAAASLIEHLVEHIVSTRANELAQEVAYVDTLKPDRPLTDREAEILRQTLGDEAAT